MFCTACGNEVIVTAIICPKCGSPTGQSAPRSTVTYNRRHPVHLIMMGILWTLIFNLIPYMILAIVNGATSYDEGYAVGYQLGSSGWGRLILYISVFLSVWGTLSGKLFGTQYPSHK